jgi:molecular chaperone DnaK (HSP70)
VTSPKTIDVEIVQHWPGGGHISHNKVPTVLAYQQENEDRWGGDAIDTKTKVKWGLDVEPEMVSYAWFKLQLDEKSAPQASDADSHMVMREHPEGKAAENLSEDYLRGVYEHTVTKVREEYPSKDINFIPWSCWLTVPATWSEEAKRKTKEAAIAAGFASGSQDVLNIISEPEAAAIYALKKLTRADDPNSLKVSSTYLRGFEQLMN